MGQLLHPRVLAMLAVIAGAIFMNIKFVPHHETDDVFQKLFAHVLPEQLATGGGHGADGGHAEETHGADEHGDDEHGDDEHGADEHGADEHGDDEHGDDEHGDDEHGDDEHGDDEHGDDEHGDDATGADDHAAGGHTDGDAHGGDGHALELLLTLPLPGFLAAFDMTGDSAHPMLVLTNLQLFQLASVLLILIGFSGVASYLRTGQGDVVSRFFAGFATWLRDDVVTPVMGRETGTKFLPYFLAVFFFILFMNLMGLLPWSATPTASVFVTGALAALTLGIMIIGGMIAQGPLAFWKNLIPHVPAPLLVIMIPVELMGLIVKPVALMIRLFATMMGGHLVVLSFMGLIFYMAQAMGLGVGMATAPMWVGFAVFIMIIEAFVAMLQAYIFTQLSVIFIQGSLHPEH